MKIILDAVMYGNEKHGTQVRKGSGDPYITHPIAVSYIVASYKTSKKLPELLAACILHDTLEDTDVTFVELATKFTPLVASLVLELSNDDSIIEKIGKLAYHKKKLVAISSYALIIKLADRMHNVSDHPTQKMITETLDLMEHLQYNRKLTRTQIEMVNEIVRICNESKS